MFIPIFTVPGLLPGESPAGLEGLLAYFPTGVTHNGKERCHSPATPQTPENPKSGLLSAEEAACRSLPLHAREAQAVLDDMLRLGEEYAAGGLLKELDAHRKLQAETGGGSWSGFNRQEAADLVRFTNNQGSDAHDLTVPDWGACSAEAKASSAEEIRQELLTCQKVLLLAQSLQQRQQELATLETRYGELEKSLQTILANGEDADTPEAEGMPPVMPQAGEGRVLTEESSLSWRAVVDAAMAFLPRDAALYTADPRMALDMRDAGMLQPLPEDAVQRLCPDWPPEIVAGVLYASLPAWRLVGRRGPETRRPWLEREVELLVARPAGGWVSSAAG